MADSSLTVLTPRLLLRPFEETDAPLIRAISFDPETTRYLFFWGRDGMTPEEDARRFLRYALDAWRRDPIVAREYCVCLRDTGEAIGDASVEAIDADTAEIGWILLPGRRGRGYATEAGRAVMELGFRLFGAKRVIAHCDERNAASRRVMERLGMRLLSVTPGARPAKRPGEKPGSECTYIRDKNTLGEAVLSD